jgi:hypothetical protein
MATGRTSSSSSKKVRPPRNSHCEYVPLVEDNSTQEMHVLTLTYYCSTLCQYIAVGKSAMN